MFRGRFFTGFALLVAMFCERWCAGAQTYGLYQSLDGGVTWREAVHPFKANRVNTLYSEADHVWAGTERGLFISRDAGQSWRDLSEMRFGNIKSITSARDVMILGTKAGVWRATKGDDWSQVIELAGQYIRTV